MNPFVKSFAITVSCIAFLLNPSETNHQGCSHSFNPNTVTLQKEIISKLTGNEPVEEDVMLHSRFLDEGKRIARNYLKNLFTEHSFSLKEHSYSVPNKNPQRNAAKTFNGTNLYISLPATTRTDEFIVLGAHYDSVKDSPGANDNASGVAMLTSVFMELSTLELRTKNILLVFFDEEEKGLVGSSAFAQMLVDENYQIHSVHTVDQMGWDKDGDLALELELPTPLLQKAYEKTAKEHDILVHISPIKTTDHEAFRRLGFNAVGLTEEYINKDTTPHYHRSTDTYDTINFDYLLSSTKLMFCTLKSLVSL